MTVRAEFDAIVVGAGAMGSAAAYHLASRGRSVLCLERHDVPNDMGSSHGVTRIIRLAYYEHPSYVPLLKRAYQLWRDLQREAGEQLLHITGSIDAAPAGSKVFEGSLASAKQHGLEHEVFDGVELSRRFPAYRLPADVHCLLQPEGGFLLPERCIVAYVNGALERGADIRAREAVTGWEARGGEVRVTTDRGAYVGERVVVAAGAWLGQLVPVLRELAIPERQVLAWLQPRRPELFKPDRFPVFNCVVDEGRYYGFPVFGIPGFKFGRYHHREERVDPDGMEREPNREDEALLRGFAERYFPEGAGPTLSLKTCLFTNTPDEHFLIDRLPDAAEVVVASPCSGHGFKFASVVGEILADLLTKGSTEHNVSLFALSRFRRPSV